MSPTSARPAFWQKKVEYKRTALGSNGTPPPSDTITYTPSVVRLSTATQNAFLQTAKMVFARLMTVDLAITENPFAAIEPVTNMPVERDYFEVDEIFKLYELARAHPDRDILLPLIVIGAGMALREGDIATLRWQHIDFKNGFMIRETEKTGKGVVFPIWDNAILKFLEDTKIAQGDPAPGDHCFSDLATMYLTNRSGVSYRFKKFLEKAGYKGKTTVEIRDRKNVKVRDRAVSKLDVHSLRHSFAAIAGAAGLPLKTVQALLGHTSDRITQIYMRHVNNQELQDKLTLMPRLFGGTGTKALPSPATKMPTAEEIGEIVKLLEAATVKGWKKARDRAVAILGQVPKP